MMTLDQFQQFSEEFPELAECVCLDEAVVELDYSTDEHELY